MIRIAEFIASRKAWQIFLLLGAPLLIAQIYFVSEMPKPSRPGQPPPFEEFDQLFKATMAVGLLVTLLLLLWLLSIGLISNRLIAASLRPSIRWYLAAAVYAPIYFALAVFLFFPQPFEPSAGPPGFVFVMHFAATIAMFYMLGFSAKNLIMAERQSAVTFFDYSGPLFLMWFFPIGIWFVQPRVNKLAGRSRI